MIRTYRWPLLITLAISITAVFSLPPLLDPANPASLTGARLQAPLSYHLFAPVSDVLDMVTMLSPAQDWGMLGLCGLCFAACVRARGNARGTRFTLPSLIRASCRFLGGAVAVVGIALVADRPMASLVLDDPDLVAVDFHSHTSASHDGRAGFDAERNREWHSSAGFNAVYVTDHRTFTGALLGAEHNPVHSVDATVLLPGVELRDGDEHPILIGVDPRRMRITSPDWKDAAIAADGGPAPPMILLSMPGDVLSIPLDETTGPVRIAGIEISDGSPRGIAQSSRDREAIAALTGRLHFALVSASDNHGWGRTAPAWTVMRIPGWRLMSPARLDVAIRRTLISRGRLATKVIVRRLAPEPTSKVGVALSGVSVALLTLRTMSPIDRLSWILWSWSLGFVLVQSRRRRTVRAWLRHQRRLRQRAVEAAA
ncbi:MAG TPA: hypothetical protein VF105_14810 [Gemmatimonadaceae bacterium]